VKIVVRWRVVHPPSGEGRDPSVIFEEVVDGRRDRIQSCLLKTWPSIRSRLEESGVTFEQLPDAKELPRVESTKPRRKQR